MVSSLITIPRIFYERLAEAYVHTFHFYLLTLKSDLTMDQIITAILDNNVKAAKQQLKSEPSLVTRLFDTPKLFDDKIFHWIYVGDTLLHLAAAGHRVEIVRLLLNAGADPNAAHNHRKGRPLHYAADGFITGPQFDAGQQIETLRCLIQAGAHLCAPDMNGATPLHRAVRTRCAGAVKFLVEVGSDPSSRNKSGSTAFHLAVQNTGRGGSGEQAAIDAQREIIKFFLETGVSTNLKDNQGKTVIDSARITWIRDLLLGPRAKKTSHGRNHLKSVTY